MAFSKAEKLKEAINLLSELADEPGPSGLHAVCDRRGSQCIPSPRPSIDTRHPSQATRLTTRRDEG